MPRPVGRRATWTVSMDGRTKNKIWLLSSRFKVNATTRKTTGRKGDDETTKGEFSREKSRDEYVNEREKYFFEWAGRREWEGGSRKYFSRHQGNYFSREGGSRSTPIEYFLKNSLSGKLLLSWPRGGGGGRDRSDATIERTSLEDGINS